MASFIYNIATIKGCPPAERLVRLMTDYGMPETEEFGVLTANAVADSAFATIVKITTKAVDGLDRETGEMVARQVEQARSYPVGISPAKDRLLLYAGPYSGIEHVGAFLAGCLALPVVVEPRKIDPLKATEWALANLNRVQVKAVKISDYSANSFCIGPYGPKFLDTQHAIDLMTQHVEAIKSVQVRFQGQNGKVSLTITPAASFRFSCHEDDQGFVQSHLLKLSQECSA
jgi:hypothetical protein